MSRLHEVGGALAGTTFRKLKAVEGLSQLFVYEVELLADKKDLKPEDAIGRELWIGVKATDDSFRHFNGVISRFSNLGAVGGYQLYEVELRPWLWLLTHSRDCRIYQGLTVPQIVEKVLKDKHGFTDVKQELSSTYPALDFCVQYRESDFAFVSRLLEGAGIFYYFKHEKQKHTMVMADSSRAYVDIGGAGAAKGLLKFRPPNEVAASGEEHVVYWKRNVAVQPTMFELRDFDYEKPKTKLEVRAKKTQNHPYDKLEVYDYPGGYTEIKHGQDAVNILAEEREPQIANFLGRARSYRLATATSFKLEDHPSEDGDFAVLSSETIVISGEAEQFTSGGDSRFEVEFIAVPKSMTFRPPRLTAKPIIAGPQTAIVTGPKEKEIWTDSMGRVKVQFPWDRIGKMDETSSCWIRVAQVWSGKGWGAMHIPRVGQEVIVEFLEGDPDCPIITGRVYNGEQTVPYALPDNATQSGLLSRSSPKGNGSTFNELRFEDKKDEELIYLHAEKNFEQVVENNSLLKVGALKKDPGDQKIEIHNDQTLVIGNSQSKNGSQTIEVWKDQTATVKTGNRATTIEKGSDNLKVSLGNQQIEIPLGECLIKAGKKITLQVGASTIVIEPAKITISAPQVEVKADMKAEVSAAMTNVSGSAMVKLQGGLVKIN